MQADDGSQLSIVRKRSYGMDPKKQARFGEQYLKYAQALKLLTVWGFDSVRA